MKQKTFSIAALILFSFLNSSCKNELNSNARDKNENKVETVKNVESIGIHNIDSLLNSSKVKLESKNWIKVENSIINDEYSEWLESTFFYSKQEWVKISFGDSEGKNIN